MAHFHEIDIAACGDRPVEDLVLGIPREKPARLACAIPVRIELEQADEAVFV